VRAFAKTDIGRSRKSNQDYFYMSTEPVGPLPNLFIAADGMGGHNAGDFASRFCTEHLTAYVRGSHEQDPRDVLTHAAREVNRELLEAASKDPELTGTGTTMVAAVIRDGICCTMNIGDSRLYVADAENTVPRQVTRDHSYVEEMVSAGLMKRGSEVYNRNKNIITRAVGIGSRLEIDVFEVPLEEDTEILICSDGLTNMVSDQEIGCILREYDDVNQAAEELIRAANGHGGRDNISVVLVRPHGKGAAV